ncbi:MAG: hypothetical protein HYR72_07835 [Deltaproteobacteria bacterium]|nr:hypothetical protein [Deltaproteobacteria bacterium]MBI3386999.1 hypothetical protein [Deltaproteobacteria bacterium]
MSKTFRIVCVLTLLAASASEARPRQGGPIPVRMVAYVGEQVEGIRPEFSWVVVYEGEKYQLSVLKLSVLSGPTTSLDIDAAVAPYKVKFQIGGQNTAIKRFVSVSPRQQVTIKGYVRLDPNARFLMLDSVDFVQPPTTASPK